MPTFTGIDPQSVALEAAARRLVGEQLTNGATVIAAALRRTYFVVLAIDVDGRYATWAVSPIDGEAFWGHYNLGEIEEAVKAWRERCES